MYGYFIYQHYFTHEQTYPNSDTKSQFLTEIENLDLAGAENKHLHLDADFI